MGSHIHTGSTDPGSGAGSPLGGGNLPPLNGSSLPPVPKFPTGLDSLEGFVSPKGSRLSPDFGSISGEFPHRTGSPPSDTPLAAPDPLEGRSLPAPPRPGARPVSSGPQIIVVPQAVEGARAPTMLEAPATPPTEILAPECRPSAPAQNVSRKAGFRAVLRQVLDEVHAAGISSWDIAREGLRGAASSGLRWAGTFALYNMCVDLLAERSPAALGCIAAWAFADYSAIRLDRVWDDRVKQFGRMFGNHLSEQLLRKHGRSSFQQLEDPDLKAEKDLQEERAKDIQEVIHSLAELPSHLLPLGLSMYVLLAESNFITAGIIALAVTCAVTPQIRLNFRHARENIELEERQARRSLMSDTIMEGAYSTLGAARMIVGRMTHKVASIFRGHLDTIDDEATKHEDRQTREQRWPDRIFYGSVAAGMFAAAYQVVVGSMSPGSALFTMKLLDETANEMESHADRVDGYRLGIEKIRRFYRYLQGERPRGTQAVPPVARIEFADASFVRGDEERSFTACLPNCSPEPGDLIIIHGASGAGKTTLLKYLAFACTPVTGTIKVGGVPVSELDPDKWFGDIRYCAATPSLQEGFTVRQCLTLDPNGEDYLEERLKHPLIEALAQELLASKDGLETVIGQGFDRSREFSTGELHRLALVMAVIPPPKILFLDEVSSNQSPDFVDALREMIAEIRSQGTIVIFATHSQRFDGDATTIIKVSRGHSEVVGRDDSANSGSAVD